MSDDNRSGKNIYYCNIQPVDASLLYQIEWTLTSKLSRDRFLHVSRFMKYEHETAFQLATALTEDHLLASGVNKIGYTVSSQF